MTEKRILYCHCAYAEVIPKPTKEAVLEGLAESGVDFEATPDLCERAARCDPSLKEFVEADGEKEIIACFPRAVRSLFKAAGAHLPEEGVTIRNMKTVEPEKLLSEVLEGTNGKSSDPTRNRQVADDLREQQGSKPADGWIPWFPVIDFDRCTDCMQCLSFCLFDVYGVDKDHHITVRNPEKCKTNCPACSRVCPEVAIIFPKYRSEPINGADVRAQDVEREKMKVDVSALLGGDVYELLRQRHARAASRFSKERDENKALKERMRCLAELGAEMDIPAEVLMTLPSQEEIQAKAAEAARKAKEALENRTASPESASTESFPVS